MSGIYSRIEKIARKKTPFFIAGSAKRIIAWPRYFSQLKKCRSQFELYKGKYKQNILYVAGLPKSGTTWLEKMLCSFPGFAEIMIPEAVAYEQRKKESHSFELPTNIFKRLSGTLAVLKLHTHASAHNFDVLQKNNIRYVVLFRDLRDVAVSHVFYVKRTAYHPEHRDYKDLSAKEGLLHFSKTLLPEFISWIDSWQQYASSSLSYILKYEDLSCEPFAKMKEITNHFGISTTDEEIKGIIERNSFENLSGGRKKGVADSSSFFRSGTSGSWRKYFDEEITSVYNNLLSDFLKRYNYEI